MWKITKAAHGFDLVFAQQITADEMLQWKDEAERQLTGPLPGQWGVVVDMRTLSPLDQKAQDVMVEGQKRFKERGMVRSAVALNGAVTTLQFRRLAKSSGIDAWERYIDASVVKDWETAARNWVTKGVEPPV